ncbi:MAG: winged helix-turn-helix transcriptional regulator [Promethearchaeota archaeon]
MHLNNYKELIELIPLIQENALKSLKMEFNMYEFDERQLNLKFKLFKEIIAILQGKWTVEICYTLLIYGESSFNQLKRMLPEISNRTLTDRLRSLEKKRIIIRTVYSKGPIHVYYELSDFGKEEILLLIPALLYYVLPFRYKKNNLELKTIRASLPSEFINKPEEIIGKRNSL